VPNYATCPITDIVIIQEGLLAEYYPEYKREPLQEGWELGHTTKAPYMPVVSFKVNEGSPCIEPKETDMIPHRYKYKLSKTKHEGCKTTLNDDFYFDD
jgi:hypothetical protein